MLIDLTEKWYELRAEAPSVEKAWREYRKLAPELFDDYECNWGAAPKEGSVELSREECRQRVRMIKEDYARVGPRLVQVAGFTETLPDLYLIIASSQSNGHAICIDQRFAAWVDVTAYPTPMITSVFVTHELAHAIHYSLSPTAHSTAEAHHLVIRRLWAEGVATYMTMCVLECTAQEALWADYLAPDKLASWMARCAQEEARLFAELKEQAWQVDLKDRFFVVDDRRPLEEWRTGYYCGLKLASQAAERAGVPTMLRMPLQEIGRCLDAAGSAPRPSPGRPS